MRSSYWQGADAGGARRPGPKLGLAGRVPCRGGTAHCDSPLHGGNLGDSAGRWRAATPAPPAPGRCPGGRRRARPACAPPPPGRSCSGAGRPPARRGPPPGRRRRRPTSSLRRNAPANPSSSRARSRRPSSVSGSVATIARTSAVSAGALPACAVPLARRMPAHTARTVACRVGESWAAWPASWWACEIDDRRRCSVLVLDRYREVVTPPGAHAPRSTAGCATARPAPPRRTAGSPPGAPASRPPRGAP